MTKFVELAAESVPLYIRTASAVIYRHNYTATVSILRNTTELHKYRLIGTVSHSDMQKIRIIGFFV